MRLFVLGATGAIGQHLLQIGLERGHQITAFVRSPDKISQRLGLLKVVQGDVFNASQLAQCLAGHDCVLSAFGPATLRATTLRRDFSRALALALRDSKVPRVEIISAAFLFPNIGALGYVLTRTLFRNMVPDMTGMECEIMQSWIDWTVIRPPRLTNGPATRTYRIADDRLPEGGRSVSRADVAEFIIGEAENPDTFATSLESPASPTRRRDSAVQSHSCRGTLGLRYKSGSACARRNAHVFRSQRKRTGFSRQRGRALRAAGLPARRGPSGPRCHG
jgi:putative NADH-flavin reductase